MAHTGPLLHDNNLSSLGFSAGSGSDTSSQWIGQIEGSIDTGSSASTCSSDAVGSCHGGVYPACRQIAQLFHNTTVLELAENAPHMGFHKWVGISCRWHKIKGQGRCECENRGKHSCKLFFTFLPLFPGAFPCLQPLSQVDPRSSLEALLVPSPASRT